MTIYFAFPGRFNLHDFIGRHEERDQALVSAAPVKLIVP